jgi:hypothetical protein
MEGSGVIIVVSNVTVSWHGSNRIGRDPDGYR